MSVEATDDEGDGVQIDSQGQPAAHSSDGAAALDALLARNPDAILLAMGSDGRLVPMPATVPVHGQRVFSGRSAIGILIDEDHVRVIEAWARAQDEPVVSLMARPAADPDDVAPLHFFDVRRQHGVHVIAIEASSPDLLMAAASDPVEMPAAVAHVKRDAMSVFIEVDAAMTALVGWAAEELVGKRTVEFVHPDDLSGAIDAWMDMRRGAEEVRSRIRFRHADDHYVWLEITNDDRLDDPDHGCVLSEIVDITDEMAELQALHDRERMLQRLAETLPIGICHLHPDRGVVFSNPPLVALLGAPDSIDGLVARFSEPDRGAVARAIERAMEGRPDSIEVGVFHGYEERRCELTLRAMANEHGSIDGVVLCTSDVTDRSRLRSELEHRASHDALSGCLNRAATVTALERALREHEQVAVAYIDLDRFKTINDELGHAAGDELLRVAAARLRGVTRSGDRLGRMGGDEFVVICPQGDHTFEPDELLERLQHAIDGPVSFARQRIPLGASVGVAVSTGHELEPEALLGRADAAMYEAKRAKHAPVLRALHTADGPATA